MEEAKPYLGDLQSHQHELYKDKEKDTFELHLFNMIAQRLDRIIDLLQAIYLQRQVDHDLP